MRGSTANMGSFPKGSGRSLSGAEQEVVFWREEGAASVGWESYRLETAQMGFLSFVRLNS